MKHLYTVLLLLICVFSVTNSDATEAQISVTGRGAILVSPDQYQLTMSFEERGPIVTKLNSTIQQNLARVIEFLKKQGIDEKHMQSMQISLQPWIEHTREGSQQRGFIISRQLRITDNRIAQFDAIIDGVLTRGVNRIDGFELMSSQHDIAYQEALVMALQDANQTAEKIAKTMGVRVKSLVSISPSTEYRTVSPRMLMAAEQSLALAGQESVSAVVNVTFAVE